MGATPRRVRFGAVEAQQAVNVPGRHPWWGHGKGTATRCNQRVLSVTLCRVDRSSGRVGVETFLPGFEGQLDSQLAAPPPNTPPQGGPYHGSTDGGPLLRAAVLLVVVAAISVLRPGGGELLDVGLCSVKLG